MANSAGSVAGRRLAQALSGPMTWRQCYDDCRYCVTGGSRNSSGGSEPPGYDQEGCSQPLLVETYAACEPAGMLLEGLMIQAAESNQGCGWYEEATEAVEGS